MSPKTLGCVDLPSKVQQTLISGTVSAEVADDVDNRHSRALRSMVVIEGFIAEKLYPISVCHPFSSATSSQCASELP